VAHFLECYSNVIGDQPAHKISARPSDLSAKVLYLADSLLGKMEVKKPMMCF
jgi:hypothetical protein